MKFLVTGGAGFIGSNFTKKALELGHEVLVLDNLSTGKRENLDPRAKFIEVDLCDYVKMSPYFSGVDYVFHFAALPCASLSIEKPLETNRNNLESTINVLSASRDSGVKRVIYSASAAAYGAQEESPLREDMPAAPVNPYGIQKYAGELYVKIFYALFGIGGVILRYFNVFGPNMTFDNAYANVIMTFLRQKKAGAPLTIFGNGDQVRDFVYVDDVIEANLQAALRDQVGRGETINIGTGRGYSVNAIADLLGGDKKYLESRRGDARTSIADISLARNLLNWEPKVSLEDGLNRIKTLY